MKRILIFLSLTLFNLSLFSQEKIFSKDFRTKFKELKNYKGIYVFNKNDKGCNSFSTDGDKLLINYSIDDNGNSKAVDQTIFSNLRHETTYGAQSERGEIEFTNSGNSWSAVNYDLTDEFEASNSQNFGFIFWVTPESSRNKWTQDKTTDSERIQVLYRAYPHLINEIKNNYNTLTNPNRQLN